MTLNAALAASATLVAIAFALSTLDRWLRRRRPHELAWAISLSLFAVGSGALWWAESRGWSNESFKVFFLAGAVLNVPFLALGSVYLQFGRRIGDHARSWLILLSGFATGVVLVAPEKFEIGGSEFPTAKEVFGVAPRVLAAVGSGVPALFIFFAALWSAYRLMHHRSPSVNTAVQREVRSPKSLVVGNLLIALGTAILSASGSLSGRLGKDRSFTITLLAGIIVLFMGFLVSTSGAARSNRRP